MLEHRGLVVGLGQRVLLVELADAVELRLGIGEPRPRHLETGLGLIEGVLQDALVDARQQSSFLDRVAGVDGEFEDLPRGLRLYLDGGDRLDAAGGFDSDADVAADDFHGFEERFFLHRFVVAEERFDPVAAGHCQRCDEQPASAVSRHWSRSVGGLG